MDGSEKVNPAFWSILRYRVKMETPVKKMSKFDVQFI